MILTLKFCKNLAKFISFHQSEHIDDYAYKSDYILEYKYLSNLKIFLVEIWQF